MSSIFNCYNTIRFCLDNRINHEDLYGFIVEARIGVLEDVTVSEVTLFRQICRKLKYRYAQDDLISLISCAKTIHHNSSALVSMYNSIKGLQKANKAYNILRLSEVEQTKFRSYFKVLSMGDYDTFLSSTLDSDIMLNSILTSLYTVVSINFKREGISKVLNSSAVNRILKDTRLADVFLYRIMYVSVTTAETENVVSFLTYLVDTVIQLQVTRIDIDMNESCNNEIIDLEEEIKELKKRVPKATYSCSPTLQDISLEDDIFIEADPIELNEVVRLSDNEKRKRINKRDILIVKSKDVHLKPFSKNFRIEDINNVSKEVLKGDFERVVILTKRIPHSAYYRVRDLTSLPLYFVSNTNKDRLLVEIYDRMVGVNNAL